MKQLFLLASLWLLVTSRLASAAPLAPANTIIGHAHLVHLISQEFCTEITNDHTTAFNDLTPEQAKQLTQKLFTKTMLRDSVTLMNMMNEAAKQQLSPRQVGQQLGWMSSYG